LFNLLIYSNLLLVIATLYQCAHQMDAIMMEHRKVLRLEFNLDLLLEISSF